MHGGISGRMCNAKKKVEPKQLAIAICSYTKNKLKIAVVMINELTAK